MSDDTAQKTRAWIETKGRSRVVAIRKAAEVIGKRLAKARLPMNERERELRLKILRTEGVLRQLQAEWDMLQREKCRQDRKTDDSQLPQIDPERFM
jgi:hypothetical protein